MTHGLATQLTDDELLGALLAFASDHRVNMAAMVTHLAEMDRRRLYLGLGFRSLFEYCREVLKLSESETFNRTVAARAAREFPAILDLLEAGSINLTTVRLLAPHLREDNHSALLAGSVGRSKRDVEKLIAGHFPRPDVSFSIRRLPKQRGPAKAGTFAVIVPMSEDRYSLRVAVRARTREGCGRRRIFFATAFPMATKARSSTAPLPRCWRSWCSRSSPRHLIHGGQRRTTRPGTCPVR